MCWSLVITILYSNLTRLHMKTRWQFTAGDYCECNISTITWSVWVKNQILPFDFFSFVSIKDIISLLFNTLRPKQNCRHFADDIFNTFSWIQMHTFWLIFYWNLFPWSDWQYSSVGLDNGLAPARRQALSEPMMVRLVYWLIYAQFGPNELNQRFAWK